MNKILSIISLLYKIITASYGSFFEALIGSFQIKRIVSLGKDIGDIFSSSLSMADKICDSIKKVISFRKANPEDYQRIITAIINIIDEYTKDPYKIREDIRIAIKDSDKNDKKIDSKLVKGGDMIDKIYPALCLLKIFKDVIVERIDNPEESYKLIALGLKINDAYKEDRSTTDNICDILEVVSKFKKENPKDFNNIFSLLDEILTEYEKNDNSIRKHLRKIL